VLSLMVVFIFLVWGLVSRRARRKTQDSETQEPLSGADARFQRLFSCVLGLGAKRSSVSAIAAS
jgi:hypothetical protein